jgi:Virulence factor
MNRIQVLSWQEIPSVIKVTGEDGDVVRRQLPDWFQQEIDRVAMAAGLIGSDAYLEQWAWSDLAARSGTPDEAAAAIEAELISHHMTQG